MPFWSLSRSVKREVPPAAPIVASPVKKCKLEYQSSDAEDEFERLDWRNPNSFHDCSIEVECNNQVVNIYHTHRALLVQASGYFRELFAAGSKVCRLTLGIEGVELFPDVLDYIYFQKFALNETNAVVFHYFGQVLKMKALKRQAKAFIEESLTLETAPTYYNSALILQDEKLLQQIRAKCCEPAILDALDDENENLYQIVDPVFWIELASHVTDSKKWSKMVAGYGSLYGMSADVFEQLVAPLTSVDFDVVWDLIHLEYDCLGEVGDSDLQELCIEALRDNYLEIQVPFDTLEILSKTFLVDLLHTKVEAERAKLDKDDNEEECYTDPNPRCDGSCADPGTSMPEHEEEEPTVKD